jgi:hypothetical protein
MSIHTFIRRSLEDYMVKKVIMMLICSLAFIFLSCTENPLTSVPEKTAQSQSSEKAFTFIPLPKAATGLKKGGILYDSELISASKGGKLQIDYAYQGTTDKITVSITLTVPKYALPYDQVLTMTLDEETLTGSIDVNVVFGPHGTNFLTPALLDIDTKGLDLSSLPPDADVQLYYFNPDSGNYELMGAKKETCNFKKGEIKCKGGRLPHFSRYAFGYVR